MKETTNGSNTNKQTRRGKKQASTINRQNKHITAAGGPKTGFTNKQTDERNSKWLKNKQTNKHAEERNKQAQ